MSENAIANVAGNVIIFVFVLVAGFLTGSLSVMLISFGAWPWLMWSLFGVYLFAFTVRLVSSVKKAKAAI